VKSVDADRNSITITVGAKDGATDEKYDIEKGATVVIGGQEAKLTNIKPGTQIELLLSPKNGAVGVRAGENKNGK
jgi:hypothetical protein